MERWGRSSRQAEWWREEGYTCQGRNLWVLQAEHQNWPSQRFSSGAFARRVTFVFTIPTPMELFLPSIRRLAHRNGRGGGIRGMGNLGDPPVPLAMIRASC